MARRHTEARSGPAGWRTTPLFRGRTQEARDCGDLEEPRRLGGVAPGPALRRDTPSAGNALVTEQSDMSGTTCLLDVRKGRAAASRLGLPLEHSVLKTPRCLRV